MSDFPKIRLAKRGIKQKLSPYRDCYSRLSWQLTRDDEVEWLTDQEATILLMAVLHHNNVTIDEIVDGLWENPDDQPDFWLEAIRVSICRLRRKLRTFGWSIEPGYRKDYYVLRWSDVKATKAWRRGLGNYGELPQQTG